MLEPLAAPPPSARTKGFVLESLFRGLQVQGGFLDDLRQAGYDPFRPEVSYGTQVMRRCLDVAHRHLFPTLSKEEGRRQLGRRFVQGFAETQLGKMVVSGLPLIGPVRYLRRFPEHVKMDAREEARVTAVQLGERSFRMEFRGDAFLTPDFMSGVLEEGLRLTQVEPTLSAEARGRGDFDLLVSW
ncbi:DUF2378 family protein [Aggregicoccus sp. 17bor-14]|uniref:DUF2378 family protein n=1 Tax=Myxococcaceae TaxID=31 RepID=UPI00129C7659|nr:MULTISPECIES: DUF2378 family protein [Myxococcaceae]MBF5041513.1 DUF2378 family protein [Simulacricoccus sp. 17bor-14]MRI87297.1 DUF2378 family protein [Aggregicoccus sp. 17bor-14]